MFPNKKDQPVMLPFRYWTPSCRKNVRKGKKTLVPCCEWLASLLFISELWLFPSWPSRCLMLRTWWLPVILAMVVTSPWPASSEEECPWNKWTNSCWVFRTRTPPTLSSGSRITSRQPSATFHQEDWKWLPPLLETQLPFKSSSRGSGNNSLPCSAVKLSYIGTQVGRNYGCTFG